MLGERARDQFRQIAVRRTVALDRDLLDRDLGVSAVAHDRRHAQLAVPRGAVDVARAVRRVDEIEVVVAAHEQGSVRQQRQDDAVGDHAGMAQHQRKCLVREKPRQVLLRPRRGIGQREERPRALRIGLDRRRGDADGGDLVAADIEDGLRRGVGLAGARVADIADHGEPKRARPFDHRRRVLDEIVLVVADVEDDRRPRRQGLGKRPVDQPARAFGDHIAAFEDVAVDGDEVGQGGGGNRHVDCSEHLGRALVGGMEVGEDDDAEAVGGGERRERAASEGGGGDKPEHLAARKGMLCVHRVL